MDEVTFRWTARRDGHRALLKTAYGVLSAGGILGGLLASMMDRNEALGIACFAAFVVALLGAFLDSRKSRLLYPRRSLSLVVTLHQLEFGSSVVAITSLDAISYRLHNAGTYFERTHALTARTHDGKALVLADHLTYPEVSWLYDRVMSLVWQRLQAESVEADETRAALEHLLSNVTV